MSASEALTRLITRTLSGTLMVSVAPSRALTVSVLPSTFSICPRTRMGAGGCCAERGAGQRKHRAHADQRAPISHIS